MKKIIAVITILATAFLFVGCFPHTVKFNMDFIVDSELYDTIKTDKNSIEMPADPQKDGHKFDGWFWDKDVWEKPLTLNSLMDAPLSETLRVYAKFIQDGKSIEGTLKLGKYSTEDGRSWIVLNDNNQYVFHRYIATSWRPTGNYSVQEDNILILYLEYAEFASFNIVEDYLIFQNDTPNGISLVNHGTLFRLE